MRFLQLNFIPRSVDFALLVLRVWLGLTLLLNHGWEKFTTFAAHRADFSDPLGVGSTASLSMTIFAEVICAALVTIGLLTRFAALVLIVLMTVAFFLVHQRAMSGPGSGELAFVFLAGWITLFLAGGGQYALDRRLGARA